MATRNFVPRADGEGGIGTSAKQWAGGFFKKLAVVAITTAVTVLTPSADANNQQPATTSWVRTQFKSILEGVLSASGVKYNIAQNGYVCLGSFFGGLIIQWGYETNINSKEKLIYFPIAYPTTGLSMAVAITAWETLCSTDSLTAVNFRYRGNNAPLPNLRWISLGY
ncbi:gp53-like domain-containing protein [Mitsuokella sp.]